MESLMLRQIKILLYRNYLLTKRRKCQTVQMVLYPIFLVLLLAISKISSFRPPTNYPSTENKDTLNYTSFVSTFSVSPFQIYIAPNIFGAKEFKSKLMQHPFVNGSSRVTIFSNQAAMDKAYVNNPSQSNVLGILFTGLSTYKYALRFNYFDVPGSSGIDFKMSNCRSTNISEDDCPANDYIFSKFSSLQSIIDDILIKEFNSNYQFPNLTLQRMARVGAIVNAETFTFLSAIYLGFAFLPFMVYLLVNVVAEKQQKIKEAMKVMGLSNFALWFSWSLTYGGIMLFMTIAMSIIAVFGNLFEHSNFFLVFLLLFLYGLCIEMLSFMLTAFFSNVKTANIAGTFISLFLTLLYLIVAFVPKLPLGAIWALNLLAPTGFAIAIGEVAVMEVTGVGAQFDNVWSGRYPIGITFVMLTVDIVLYFILILYFDKVVPGEYGQTEPFYFFLKPSYWCPPPAKNVSPNLINSDYPPKDFEPVSEDLHGKEAIRFSHVTKVYRSNCISIFESPKPVTAVSNFSFDIYEGQITALLGHNGAGKTTLFNILTGFVETTCGQIRVFNHDISNAYSLEMIRRMTGYCPQHNILYGDLSVREHLIIFAGIKGIPVEQTKAEVERIIKLIGLRDQAESHAIKLSGGQLRKLSVGIAIMGDPKILILDEPTAGMDPSSRHTIWNILRQRSEDRVTVFTTHFMDEADVLADRKAIISRGKLRCVGSSLFLKNMFEVGYHLGIVTKSTRDHSDVTDLVMEHVVGAEMQRSSGYELVYTLPISEVAKFSKLFQTLESGSERLDVQSFGVSMTTLEEVFFKIGEEDEVDDEDEAGDRIGLTRSNNDIVRRLQAKSSVHNYTKIDSGPVTVEDRTRFDPAVSKIGKPSPMSVFFGIIKIRILLFWRSPGYIFYGLLLPLGLAIGSGLVLNIPITVENVIDPPLINLTGGVASGYDVLLYENSTGNSIDSFVNNAQPYNLEMSSLENIYQTRGVPSYMGSNVSYFNTSQMSYTALYNVSGIHSIPGILNLMSYSMLKTINNTAPTITIYNKRWPATTPVVFVNRATIGGVFMVVFALILTTRIPILLPVLERKLKIRSQLRVSGVGFKMYWFATFFVDYVWCLIVMLGYFIGIAAFNVEAVIVPGAVAAQVLLFIGSGAASILTSYCENFLYDKYEIAASASLVILQFIAVIPYLFVSLLDYYGWDSTALLLNVIFVILIPYYVPFSGLHYITKVYHRHLQQGIIEHPSHVYFDWSEPMIPFSILMAYLHIVIFAVLLRIMDVRSNGGKVSDVLFGRGRKVAVDDGMMLNEASDVSIEDDDVREERRKVCEIVAGNHTQEEPVVIMQNLRKEFTKASNMCKGETKDEQIKVAVDNLSLSVRPGEVLGLLGPNGAGKTTAIEVLTAEHAPTSGKMFISGYDVMSNKSRAFQETGYCSQGYPLWELITLKEHLEIYAITRGVPKDSIEMTINNYVDALDIREHMNKQVKQLSGGTMRKLCFAIAMMGNPRVVLLDEPSTGMDPKTKRFMWDIISTSFQGTNRGAILTTHYMEEADALCSRVAIMVLGQLRCIGSTQHLKNKFGQGYVLEIKLKEHKEQDYALNELVATLFEKVSLPEKFSHRYVYKIAQEDVVSLAQVFATLESGKEELGIEEYSFSQSTLEQVFLQFAKEQDEKENGEQEDT